MDRFARRLDFLPHKGIKFQDGTALTAKDVKFSLDQYLCQLFLMGMRALPEKSRVWM